MPRERLAPLLAAGVIAIVAIAAIGSLMVQAVDDDEADGDPQLISIELDGSIFRFELDLEAFGVGAGDLEGLEDGALNLEEMGLPLLFALLAQLGATQEDLDFEVGGLDALRDLFGGGRGAGGDLGGIAGDLMDATPAELLRRFLDGGRDPEDFPEVGPLLERFRDDEDSGPRDRGDVFRPLADRPVLGVGVNERLAVLDVFANSPAEDAGVEVGDVIRSVDGRVVSDIGALRDALAHVEPGATFHLGVVRGDAVLTLDVERPEAQVGAPGDINERQLRELIERLQRGEIRLEQLPLQLR